MNSTANPFQALTKELSKYRLPSRILLIIIMTGIGFGIFAIAAWGFQLLWNFVISALLGTQQISFTQSSGLMAIIAIYNLVCKLLIK